MPGCPSRRTRLGLGLRLALGGLGLVIMVWWAAAPWSTPPGAAQ